MAWDSDLVVFSTEGEQARCCSHCGADPCRCKPIVEVVPERTRLRMRLERKGRSGKAVTVIFELPHNPQYFAGLLRQLKTHCGTGGAFKAGLLEIQGDQREKVRLYLEGLGFNVRQAGG